MTLEQTPAAVGSVDAIMGRAKDGPGIFNRLPHGLGIDHSQAPDAEMSVIGNSRNCEMFPLFPGSSRSDAGQRRSPEGLINRDAAGLGAGSHLPLGPLALHLHAKSGRSGYPNESGDEKRQWDRRRSLAPWIYVGSAQNFRGAENSRNKGQRQILGTNPDHRHRIQESSNREVYNVSQSPKYRKDRKPSASPDAHPVSGRLPGRGVRDRPRLLGNFWARASMWLIGAAIGMALLAALAGFADFVSEPRIRALSDAWYHMIGNLTAVVAALINFALRHSQGAEVAIKPWGGALSLIIVCILLFTGWKGWEMVYRHRVAVLDAPEQAATNARPPDSGTRRAA